VQAASDDAGHTSTVSQVSSAAVNVRPLRGDDEEIWEQFVAKSERATFFHRIAWREIFKNTFKLEPRYLIAERGRSVVGVLPLVYQRSLLFGDALVSSPFCVDGGPLATDDAAAAALTQAAVAMREATGAPYLEFRSRRPAQDGWATRNDLYATFSGPISADDNANLLSIPRKQRAVVRKTLESRLTSETDSGVDRFFAVYSESVRNLGTPVFPKRYFAELKRAFGGDCDIVTVMDGGRAISAVLNFYHRDTVLPYYGGGTASARRNGANDFLYLEVIRRAAARGYRRFDFGRSKVGTGAFAFKKNWGFEPNWLEYSYHLPQGGTLPDKNPLNPKYALLIAAWKRLPLPIANFVGPFLVGGLG